MREPFVPEFDAETYLMWESRQRGRFELHHGFVVAFAGGTADHDRIAFNIRTALDRVFPSPCRSMGSDVKISIDSSTFFYPDATVVCGEISGSETVFAEPRVVVEVLSPSTRAYDPIEKRAAYRSLKTLEAYIIVHSAAVRVEIDMRDACDEWQTVVFEAEPVPIGGGLITLEEIYARTSLGA